MNSIPAMRASNKGICEPHIIIYSWQVGRSQCRVIAMEEVGLAALRAVTARLYDARPAAPRDARHESRPSTTFGRHPPTIPFSAKIKPQVDGLRFSRNPGHGWQVGVKRSRWAGFVKPLLTAGSFLASSNAP